MSSRNPNFGLTNLTLFGYPASSAKAFKLGRRLGGMALSSRRYRIVTCVVVGAIAAGLYSYLNRDSLAFFSGMVPHSHAALLPKPDGSIDDEQPAPWRVLPTPKGNVVSPLMDPFIHREPSGTAEGSGADSGKLRIDAAIIGPFQSASVSTEVGGIIDAFHHELGDKMDDGQVVAEISKKRYSLAVRKAEERIKTLKVALARAEQEREIKATLLSMDASSIQDLMKAETEVEMTEHKIRETEIELEQARLDLTACQVKAPFSGFLATRYKEPYEAVAPLEKIFFIVDSSKVYAIANVPEIVATHFSKGSKAKFNHISGKQFAGTVDKVEPLMDPKTDTKKVHVLIDNPLRELEPGMTGSVEAGE